jgi:hypothetical protein
MRGTPPGLQKNAVSVLLSVFASSSTFAFS